MKHILAVFVLAGLLSFRFTDDIYSVSVLNMEGKKVDLNQYKGKKMLFVILPLTSTDTTIKIAELTQLQLKYPTLAIIGVPAEETGFKHGDEEKLKNLYKDAVPNFILTEGMKVKKGAGQQSLFQWLTSKDKNRHFDQDAEGVGSKFFVDEAGELYGVMGSPIKLSNPVIDRILSKTLKKQQ